jgi:hypothetical protein
MGWWLFIVFICGGVAYSIAKSKGRSQWEWGLSALIIGPLALIVIVLPPIADGKNTKNCPFCSEVIKFNAKICKYCNSQLEIVAPKQNTTKVKACPKCGNTDLRYNITDGGGSGWSCPICTK